MRRRLDSVDTFNMPDGEPWASMSSGGKRIEVPLVNGLSPIESLRAIASGAYDATGCDRLAASDFMEACNIGRGHHKNHPETDRQGVRAAKRDAKTIETPTKDERGTIMAEQQDHSAGFVRVGYPTQWIKPYEHTDKHGRIWQKAIVDILPGTVVNGVDLTGYKMDVFIKPFTLSDKAMGKPTNLSFPVSKPIELWKGEGPELIKIKVMPFDFCRSIKAARDAYRDRKEAERKAQAPVVDDRTTKAERVDAHTHQNESTPLDTLETECSAAAITHPLNGLPSIRDPR